MVSADPYALHAIGYREEAAQAAATDRNTVVWGASRRTKWDNSADVLSAVSAGLRGNAGSSARKAA